MIGDPTDPGSFREIPGLIMTSQLSHKRWHEHIAEPTHADAICDRIIHNAHKVVLTGPSNRKPEEQETDE